MGLHERVLQRTRIWNKKGQHRASFNCEANVETFWQPKQRKRKVWPGLAAAVAGNDSFHSSPHAVYGENEQNASSDNLKVSEKKLWSGWSRHKCKIYGESGIAEATVRATTDQGSSALMLSQTQPLHATSEERRQAKGGLWPGSHLNRRLQQSVAVWSTPTTIGCRLVMWYLIACLASGFFSGQQIDSDRILSGLVAVAASTIWLTSQSPRQRNGLTFLGQNITSPPSPIPVQL